MQSTVVPFFKMRRARFRLSWLMILIAFIAVALRVPGWLGDADFHPLAWWQTHRQQLAAIEAEKRRENAAFDAWRGPIVMRVTRDEELGSVLEDFLVACGHHQLSRVLDVYVDPGGLREAGQSLSSPITVDLDVKTMPARDFLRTVLEPLGLGCRLVSDTVVVTSKQSLYEPIDYGHHGEACCGGTAVLVRIVHSQGTPLDPPPITAELAGPTSSTARCAAHRRNAWPFGPNFSHLPRGHRRAMEVSPPGASDVDRSRATAPQCEGMTNVQANEPYLAARPGQCQNHGVGSRPRGAMKRILSIAKRWIERLRKRLRMPA